uniref:Alanine racemase N-terminal domain-containing protein n=1 Tax=Globodera rostochiensis TaxID=31243 RepID=A0A914IA38_GLORO
MNCELMLKNLKTVIDSIAELCIAHSVRLVAVSKHGGQRHFGENCVQELETNAHQLALKGANEIRWHYIGRIQSNMILRLMPTDALQRAIEARVNTSGEPNKRGMRPDQLLLLTKHITAQCHNLSLIGLMSIGAIAQSLGGGEENADFALLRRLRDELQVQLRLPNMLELSMGMSADYRLGRTLYGTQVNFTRALTALCKQLSASRSELHVISCRLIDHPPSPLIGSDHLHLSHQNFIDQSINHSFSHLKAD